MSKLKAFLIRNFLPCIDYYGEKLKLGEVYLKLSTQNIEYIYVGNNKLYINQQKK